MKLTVHLWGSTLAVVSALAACGGGGSGGGAEPSRVSTSQSLLGGSVNGLDQVGDAVELIETKTGATATVAGGSNFFSFGERFNYQSPYELRISAQPSGRKCEIANAAGSIGPDSDKSVVVTCRRFQVRTVLNNSPERASFGYGGRIGGIARDGRGSIFVSDSRNNLIRRVALSGTVSTWAGQTNAGYGDGHRLSARFSNPRGIAMGADGALYVADAGNHVVRRILPSGQVEVYAGVPGQSGTRNADRLQATFRSPEFLLFDDERNLYVTDVEANQVRVIGHDAAATLGAVSLLAGDSAGLAGSYDLSANGLPLQVDAAFARFNKPMGLAWKARGALLVADSENNDIRLLQKNSQGVWMASVWVRSEEVKSPNAQGQYLPDFKPERLAVDAAGVVHVSNYADTPLAISPAMQFSPSPYADDTRANHLDFSVPGRTLVASISNPGYALEAMYLTLTERDGSGKVLSTYVDGRLSGTTSGSHNGSGLASHLSGPRAVAPNSLGGYLLVDSGSATPLYIDIDGGARTQSVGLTPALTTIQAITTNEDGDTFLADQVGSRIISIRGDGATVSLLTLYGVQSMVHVAKDHALWVVAQSSKTDATLSLQRVDLAVAIPQAVKYTVPGLSLGRRSTLAHDADGNLYVSEERSLQVSRISLQGQVLASYPLKADGDDSGMRLPFAMGMAVADDGSIWVACKTQVFLPPYYSQYVIHDEVRHISRAGIVKVIAGGEAGNVDGEGTIGRFNFGDGLIGLYFEPGLGLLVPDPLNLTMRLVD